MLGRAQASAPITMRGHPAPPHLLPHSGPNTRLPSSPDNLSPPTLEAHLWRRHLVPWRGPSNGGGPGSRSLPHCNLHSAKATSNSLTGRSNGGHPLALPFTHWGGERVAWARAVRYSAKPQNVSVPPCAFLPVTLLMFNMHGSRRNATIPKLWPSVNLEAFIVQVAVVYSAVIQRICSRT